MAETYKLYYVEMKGLAEPIRFLLSYLDAKFEDVRLKREEWPKLKPSTPFGKMPILEINGEKTCQSVAISRYLGKKAGLAGKNELENLRIDMAVDSTVDFFQACLAWFHERNEECKAKKHKALLNETLPLYAEKCDALLKKNGGYVANGQLSWGDIYVVALVDTLNLLLGFDFTEKSSNLKALYNKVHAIPQIKAWVEKRPKDILPNSKPT